MTSNCDLKQIIKPSLTLDVVIYGNKRRSSAIRSFSLVSIFALPFTISILAFFILGIVIPITLSVALAVLWLVLSPFLIYSGYSSLDSYFRTISKLMSPLDFKDYRIRCLELFFNRKHLFASIPLCIVMGACAYWYGVSGDRSVPELFWLVSVFGILGFTSGIGFWGVAVLPNIVNSLSRHELKIDHSHPDQFGGLRSVGAVLAKGTTLFFSGSLLIPFAFDLLDISKIAHVEIITYFAFVAFILVGVVSFFVGVFGLHRFVFDQKVRIDRDSGMRLNALIEENIFQDSRDLAAVLKPWIYYTTYHSRISEMKEYPYNTRTIVELAGSVLIPVSVFVLDKLLR